VKFAWQFGLSPQVLEQTGEGPVAQQPITQLQLERFVVESNGLKDVVKWRETLGTLEGQVGRVEIPKGTDSEFGTGFLLGPNVLITNHHVMRLVKAKLVKPEDDPPLRLQAARRWTHRERGHRVSAGGGLAH
jgi:hypothetical protein